MEENIIVDRRWVQRNLGFDPIARPAPVATFAFAKAADPRSALAYWTTTITGKKVVVFKSDSHLLSSVILNSMPALDRMCEPTAHTTIMRAGSAVVLAEALGTVCTLGRGTSRSRSRVNRPVGSIAIHIRVIVAGMVNRVCG